MTFGVQTLEFVGISKFHQIASSFCFCFRDVLRDSQTLRQGQEHLQEVLSLELRKIDESPGAGALLTHLGIAKASGGNMQCAYWKKLPDARLKAARLIQSLILDDFGRFIRCKMHQNVIFCILHPLPQHHFSGFVTSKRYA